MTFDIALFFICDIEIFDTALASVNILSLKLLKSGQVLPTYDFKIKLSFKQIKIILFKSSEESLHQKIGRWGSN